MGFDGILGGAEEGFDAQVLFDPFEEQLDPPAVAVEFGDGECGEGEVVGEELEGGVCLGVEAGKGFDVAVAVITPDAAAEGFHGQMGHDLGKDELTGRHEGSSW